MSEAKIYQMKGYYMKAKQKIPLTAETRAMSLENALEKVFSDLGGRYGVKRNAIFIEKDTGVKIIEESTNARYRDFEQLDEDDFVLIRS